MKMAIHRSSSWTRCGRAGVANVYLLLTAAGTAAAMLCYLFLLSPPRSSVREDTPVITLHRVNYSSSFSSPWMNNMMMRLDSSSSSGSTDNNPPATATKGSSSSSNYSVGMEKIYDELDIDDKRKALRLTQRFNLLEEEEEEEATTATGHHQVNECTVQYANDNRLQQNHPCVIQLIRRHFLQPPAPKESLLNLKFPNHTNPSAGQSQAILQYLRNQTNGFFFECGAYDGEAISNTLYMERFLNWTGVLVEAHDTSYRKLLAKKRKSWSLPVCLSLQPYPTQMAFDNGLKRPYNGRVVDSGNAKDFPTVQCFPLYSILLAVNRTTVDYLSLDVEGHEMQIIKTIPWHKINVTVVTAEWTRLGPDGEEEMSRYMNLHGFVRFGLISEYTTQDVVYVQDFLQGFRNWL